MSMATKGPSNHYGNTRGGRQGHPTGKISFAWAKGFNKKTLDKHFDEHGKNMGFHTKESYAAHAVKFANDVDRKNCVSFVDAKSGSTYKYNKVTNELAIVTKDGYVTTYYKPDKGYDYYKTQMAKHGPKRRK